MVRNYKKKEDGRNKIYNQDNLTLALAAVRANNMSVRAAAKSYMVPKSTIHRWLINKNSSQRGAGRPTVLTVDEEKLLVECICTLGEWGFPLQDSDVLDIVQDYMKSKNIRSPFKEHRPGKDWLKSFLRRWKSSLSFRSPEILQVWGELKCYHLYFRIYFL